MKKSAKRHFFCGRCNTGGTSLNIRFYCCTQLKSLCNNAFSSNTNNYHISRTAALQLACQKTSFTHVFPSLMRLGGCFFFWFSSHLPGIVFALLLQLSTLRNSDPGSHSRHFSPPPSPLRWTPSFLSREELSTFCPRRLAPNRAYTR